MMTDEEPDKEELQEELGQIKEAMGIHERYPYMTKIWLTEGVLVGVLLLVLQVIVHREIPFYWYGIFAVGLILIEQTLFRRIVSNVERTATGPKPSLNMLVGAVVLGIFALVIGLDPLIAHRTVNEVVVSAVIGSVLFGILYLAVGTMLVAYSIRNTDRYAIYLGGLWLLVLAIALTHVSFLQDWPYAAFGVSVIAHGLGSYFLFARV